MILNAHVNIQQMHVRKHIHLNAITYKGPANLQFQTCLKDKQLNNFLLASLKEHGQHFNSALPQSPVVSDRVANFEASVLGTGDFGVFFVISEKNTWVSAASFGL